MDQLTLSESYQRELSIAENPITWQRDWRNLGRRVPTPVLLLFLALIFIDLLCFIFAGMLLHTHNPTAFVMWLLIPPFAQPVSIMLGVLFAWAEAPWVGRFYAALTLFSAIAPITVILWLVFYLYVDSWAFDLMEMLFIMTLKVALFFVAHLHIANLETSYDLLFDDHSQADFLGGIISGGDPATARNAHLDSVVDDEPVDTRASYDSCEVPRGFIDGYDDVELPGIEASRANRSAPRRAGISDFHTFAQSAPRRAAAHRNEPSPF